jgi:hypothetical protein
MHARNGLAPDEVLDSRWPRNLLLGDDVGAVSSREWGKNSPPISCVYSESIACFIEMNPTPLDRTLLLVDGLLEVDVEHDVGRPTTKTRCTR